MSETAVTAISPEKESLLVKCLKSITKRIKLNKIETFEWQQIA